MAINRHNSTVTTPTPDSFESASISVFADIASQSEILPPELLDKDKLEKLAKSKPNLVAELGREILARAKAITITNDAEYDLCTRDIQDIKRGASLIEQLKRPAVKEADELHLRLVEDLRNTLKPYKEAEAHIKDIRGKYRAERDRIQAEIQAKRDADMRALAEAQVLEEAAALLASTSKADREKGQELIQAVSDDTLPDPVASLPAIRYTPLTSKGSSVKKLKRFKILDESAIKRQFLMVNEKAIQALVDKIGKDAESIVGGIEVYFVESEGIRS